MLSKPIIDLLQKNNRVIIPDFGAFMVKDDAQKSIYFNEFLRFNDGLLIDHLQKEENLDKSKAAKKIREFVDTVNKALVVDRKYLLKGLGRLYLDENNKTQFESDSVISKAGLASKSKEVKPEPGKASSGKPIVDNTAKAEDKQDIPPVIEPPKKEIADPVNEPPITRPAPVVIRDSRHRKKFKQAESKQNKSSRPFVWYAAAVVVLLGVGLYLFLVQDILGLRESGQAQSESILIVEPELDATREHTFAPVDSIARDEKIIEKKTPSFQPTTVSTPVSPNTAENRPAAQHGQPGQYLVIAGCFSVEANADRYVSELKSKGLDAVKIGMINDLHAVSIQRYMSKEEASRELNRVKDQVPGVWLFRKRN
jgi:nucleoid DNA-binding protein/cell division septation protein DedD